MTHLLFRALPLILIWGSLAIFLTGWISQREQTEFNILAVVLWFIEDIRKVDGPSMALDIVLLLMNLWFWKHFNDDDRPRKRRKKFFSAKGAALKAKLKSFAPSPLPSPSA